MSSALFLEALEVTGHCSDESEQHAQELTAVFSAWAKILGKSPVVRMLKHSGSIPHFMGTLSETDAGFDDWWSALTEKVTDPTVRFKLLFASAFKCCACVLHGNITVGEPSVVRTMQAILLVAYRRLPETTSMPPFFYFLHWGCLPADKGEVLLRYADDPSGVRQEDGGRDFFLCALRATALVEGHIGVNVRFVDALEDAAASHIMVAPEQETQEESQSTPGRRRSTGIPTSGVTHFWNPYRGAGYMRMSSLSRRPASYSEVHVLRTLFHFSQRLIHMEDYVRARTLAYYVLTFSHFLPIAAVKGLSHIAIEAAAVVAHCTAMNCTKQSLTLAGYAACIVPQSAAGPIMAGLLAQLAQSTEKGMSTAAVVDLVGSSIAGHPTISPRLDPMCQDLLCRFGGADFFTRYGPTEERRPQRLLKTRSTSSQKETAQQAPPQPKVQTSETDVAAARAALWVRLEDANRMPLRLDS